jgi:uncharacterized membrane protein
METESIILLVIIVAGGLAVLGSYVLGLRGGSEGSSALWGGVPERARPVYVGSMLVSVIGYFGVLWYLFFELAPAEIAIGGQGGFTLLYPIFVLILIPSALWLPLTKHYQRDPKPARWIAVRSVLFLVGLASIALVWALFALEPAGSGVAYWFAVAGSLYFAFHTFVLDGLVWAAVSKLAT